MYDEKLVRAAQEGDEAAFAAIYDRSADAVFDFCWSLIGDAEEASRIVEETFVLAARHLADLSDASQVRAWLLAIARDRILTEEDHGTLRSGWGTAHSVPGQAGADAPLGTVALRTWTAGAAAVLALTDQAVLELHLRHQLDGDQLAAAIGCPPGELTAVIERVEAEAEHVLGALVVARQARRDCPELLALLSAWDGTPTAEVAELVDSHATTCERCNRRRALVSPLELIVAAPVVAAPAALRTQVLDIAGSELADHRIAAAGMIGDAATGVVGDGAALGGAAAVAEVSERKRRPLAPLFAVAAAVIVLAGALVMVLHSPSRQQTAAALRTGNLSIAPGPTTAASGAPTTAPPSLTPLATSTTTATSLPPTARLALNASRVDFGTDATSAQITLQNTGAAATDWASSSGVSWIAAVPGSGHLGSTGAVSVTLTVDRRLAPKGPFEVRVSFQPADATQPPASIIVVGSVTGSTTTSTSSTSTSTTVPSTSTTVGSGPAVSNVVANPSTVYAAPCSPDTSSVTATVTDSSTVTSVTMVYVLADGRRGATPMTQGSQGQWSATLGPSSSPGTTSFHLDATDASGGHATSDTYAVSVAACH